MSLQSSLAFTLPAEGGFVDNPLDSGGATMHGVTQTVYDRYRLSIGELNQSVRLISDDEVQHIYSEMYWTPAHCPDLSERVGICHFDWAVNHGVSGAIETLQGVIGVTQDGIFGQMTANAVQAMDESTLIVDYLDARAAWYKQRVVNDPSQSVFLTDWLNRVQTLREYLATLEAAQ